MLAQYAKARVDVRRAIRAAVRATHPMARAPRRWREDFMASLTARDKVELDLAIEYWRETWLRLSLPRPRQEGRADDLPPSQAAGGLAAGM